MTGWILVIIQTTGVTQGWAPIGVFATEKDCHSGAQYLLDVGAKYEQRPKASVCVQQSKDSK